VAFIATGVGHVENFLKESLKAAVRKASNACKHAWLLCLHRNQYVAPERRRPASPPVAVAQAIVTGASCIEASEDEGQRPLVQLSSKTLKGAACPSIGWVANLQFSVWGPWPCFAQHRLWPVLVFLRRYFLRAHRPVNARLSIAQRGARMSTLDRPEENSALKVYVAKVLGPGPDVVKVLVTAEPTAG
jgi:hypothetical protein